MLRLKPFFPVRIINVRIIHDRWLAMGLLLLLLLVAPRAVQPTVQAQVNLPLRVSGSTEVSQRVAQTGAARVLLLLDDQALGAVTVAQQPALVAELQTQVLGKLTPTEFQPYRQYHYVPGLAGTVNAAGLAKLQADPLVAAIQLDHPGQAHLQESLPGLDANLVHTNAGLTGNGVTVAVLDSGIDSDHPDLGPALVAQHCFTNSNCPPAATVESDSAEDANGHGSHVAGVITADGVVVGPGFAPDANIVAVRVLDGNGGGFVSDWIAGLDWVRANLATTPVQIVNLSLGTFALYAGNCDAQEPLMAAAVNLLRAQGVTIFASSGNQGSSTRISAPACNSGVLAVGATYDSNVGRQPTDGTYQSNFGGNWPACADTTTALQTITCFTNSNSELDMVAPGAPIVSAYLGGGSGTYWGTSQASPTAAGIAALLLDRNPTLSPAAIETLLKASGSLITDPKNNRQFPLINARAAVDLITPVAPQTVTLSGPTVAPVGFTYLFTATVLPPTVTVPLTYTWHATDLTPVEQRAGQSTGVNLRWLRPGPKTVTVTASNAGGTVTQTHHLTLTAIAPTGISVQSPSRGYVGVLHPLTATVTPLTVTLPLTYLWQVDDAISITQTGGLTDQVDLLWPQAGVYTVTVHALNAGGIVSATQVISVVAVAPLTVTLRSELTVTLGVSTSVIAQVLPLTVSLPLTYLWQATDQLPLTHTAGISDSVRYQWQQPGTVTVTVQVDNGRGMVMKQAVLQVVERRRVYLPVVVRP